MRTQSEQLLVMIHQIIDNNSYGKSQEQIAQITAQHLKKFWARPMKQQIIDYLQQDGSQLSEPARLAVHKLKEMQSLS